MTYSFSFCRSRVPVQGYLPLSEPRSPRERPLSWHLHSSRERRLRWGNPSWRQRHLRGARCGAWGRDHSAIHYRHWLPLSLRLGRWTLQLPLRNVDDGPRDSLHRFIDRKSNSRLKCFIHQIQHCHKIFTNSYVIPRHIIVIINY